MFPSMCAVSCDIVQGGQFIQSFPLIRFNLYLQNFHSLNARWNEAVLIVEHFKEDRFCMFKITVAKRRLFPPMSELISVTRQHWQYRWANLQNFALYEFPSGLLLQFALRFLKENHARSLTFIKIFISFAIFEVIQNLIKWLWNA